MRGKLVTVFGGSGFLGRYVVQRLANKGAQVRVATRFPDEALDLKTMGEIGQITPLAVNIDDRESVAKAVKDAYGVVNLIGILFETKAHSFHDVHVKGPATIAKLAHDQKVKRLVHVSAIGADTKGSSRYAQTKGKGEIRVLEHFPDATIIRPSIMFGEEDQFFNRFAAIARCSPFLPLFGGGHNRMQPVYVCDVADAIAKIICDSKATKSPHAGKTYELGGPKVYSFKELMEFVLRETHRRRLLLPLPYEVGTLLGSFLQYLPTPPLTSDQIKLLRRDNIVAPKALGFKKLGIEPTSIEMIVPGYLKRYRYYG